MIATDAAGKTSAPSKPIVILPDEAAAEAPEERSPTGRGRCSSGMQSGKTGNRPKAPKILPSWYWRWYDWRAAPFHVRA